MKDLEQILPLWRDLEAQGHEYVLATVVAVEGSSYRKPGACMLLARDGRRAGTVSGGCLEAAVMRKAWWLTENGPVVERYSTLDDDGDLPYGSGCGGIVRILLERRSTAQPFLQALEAAFHARAALGVATILDGPRTGIRAFASAFALPEQLLRNENQNQLYRFAARALDGRASFPAELQAEGDSNAVSVTYYAARPGLWIFGAGDDAKPLVNLARELGWYVAVADGRANLAVRDRFPNADTVQPLAIQHVPGDAWRQLDVRKGDAAVLLTHSFEQDSRVLAALLASDLFSHLSYIGVLGPQRRTRQVLAESARLLGEPASADLVELRLEQLHAPTGLDLGGEAPAAVALSILAEVQKAITGSTGRPLRNLRAVPAPVLS